MMEFVATLNYWLALGVIGLQLGAAYLLIEHFFLTERYVGPYVQRYALWIVLALSLAASALTLVYSEAFGFIPCGLCWMERVFLYPITFAVALALLRERTEGYARAIAELGMVLSTVGGIIALYHHYLQMGGTALGACPTAGEGADCAHRLIFEFGYVTFPLMAASVSLFLFVVLMLYWYAPYPRAGRPM